ncbi:MAG TPA: transcriptional regulator [Muricauda sp.]|uniref:winged helix-turn-helix transcriptional regulator n=1 Tax=Flagellimonas amoyensis TaxID=2169401 RepID=UPI000C661FAE|nr:helix-turn-helix domain-containing protein [Allomuricauda amoyensis]MBC73528.1 transcriptional regulator [Allomuricauda sp.]HBU77791.1 transcriptional regulator [Allomuricauda sp.]|tara:strand:- start:12158 stop:12532 length:375 start_codon:yes stop_codon:yes gene_type:complete
METENKKRQPSYICTIADQEEIKYAQDALFVLNGKWRLPVIIAIYNGAHRYREIAKNIPGITFAMLSKELKHMELNNLVLRIEDPDFPKDVEYRLTEYCESLYPLVENLITWGKQHRREISSQL